MEDLWKVGRVGYLPTHELVPCTSETSMSSEERTVYGLEAPLRLVASHDIALPGFQSARRGEFVLLSGSSQDASALHCTLPY